MISPATIVFSIAFTYFALVALRCSLFLQNSGKQQNSNYNKETRYGAQQQQSFPTPEATTPEFAPLSFWNVPHLFLCVLPRELSLIPNKQQTDSARARHKLSLPSSTVHSHFRIHCTLAHLRVHTPHVSNNNATTSCGALDERRGVAMAESTSNDEYTREAHVHAASLWRTRTSFSSFLFYPSLLSAFIQPLPLSTSGLA